jgi:EpsI family protein
MGTERARLILLSMLLSIAFAGAQAATRFRVSQTRLPDWRAIHYQFGGWSGADTEFDPVYGADPAETSVLRVYRRGSEPPVVAYVGFYGNLAKILEMHTPERCYPGQGWRILSSGKFRAAIFRGKQIPAQEIIVEKRGNRRLVLWWYNAGSRPFETRIRYVYAMLAMSAFTGRTDGSLVRIETPLDAGGETAATQRIEEFRNHFLSQIDGALPQ